MCARSAAMATVELIVEGMSCGKCQAKVTAALEAVDGVDSVTVTLDEHEDRMHGSAVVVGTATVRALTAACDAAGKPAREKGAAAAVAPAEPELKMLSR